MGQALSYVFNNVFMIYFYVHQFYAQIVSNIAIDADVHISIEGRTSNSWVLFQRCSLQRYMHKMPVTLPF